MKYSIHEKEDYYGYIYITLDQKHNKVYVGQKKGKIEDSKDYFGSGTIISNIKKDRGNYFLKKTVLGVCYSKEELTFWETECKHFFKALDNKYGYNIIEKDNGGDYMTNHPDRERIIADISKTLTGRKQSPETVEKRISKLKNHITSEETKKKISEGNKDKIVTEETREKLKKAKLNVKNSEESKKKASLSLKGKKKSKEHCKNMSKAKKGEKHPMYGKNHSLESISLIIKGQSGKNNYQYITLDYKFLIKNYFNIISLNSMRDNYNHIFNLNISHSTFSRFLKILNFPINTLSKNCKKKKEIYLKFVEENKHKINWYIENYERLEEEYNENKLKLKLNTNN